jgi:hypothetical protein
MKLVVWHLGRSGLRDAVALTYPFGLLRSFPHRFRHRPSNQMFRSVNWRGARSRDRARIIGVPGCSHGSTSTGTRVVHPGRFTPASSHSFSATAASITSTRTEHVGAGREATATVMCHGCNPTQSVNNLTACQSISASVSRAASPANVGTSVTTSTDPAAAVNRSNIATVGSISPRSIRVTVEGVTPAFTASARHDNPARTRDRARRSPTIWLAYMQRRGSWVRIS